MKQSCLLIDIDIDYMLDRKLPESHHRNQFAVRWISSDHVFQVLGSKGLSSIDYLELCEDHSEAYSFWKSIGVSGCTCIHIDTHSDMYGSRIEPERLLSIGYKPVAGNYLRFAVASGIIDELVLVPPDWFSLSSYLDEELSPYGYHDDPRIKVCYLSEVELPSCSFVIVTIATSPQYTPSWVDVEAERLFHLFECIKNSHGMGG